MKSFVRILALVAALTAGPAVRAQTTPPQPSPQQEEFVPLDQLPPEAELPAAPMVVAAYGFIWVAFLVYVISLVNRVRKVEGELQRLEREQHR
jgi:CcmD family protein